MQEYTIEGTRGVLPPSDPNFWAFYRSKPIERRLKAAASLSAWWTKVKRELPDEPINGDQFQDLLSSFDEVSSEYADVGACDSEGRQGVQLLLAKHYNLPYSYFYQLWLNSTPPIEVNLPPIYEGNKNVEQDADEVPRVQPSVLGTQST